MIRAAALSCLLPERLPGHGFHGRGPVIRAAALSCLLLLGCVPDKPAPPPVAAKPVDLDALAARRAASSGAALEVEAAMERSAHATAVRATAEGEPDPVEVAVEARPSAGVPAGGTTSRPPGSSGGPSDLDRADDGTEPWIDMDGVSRAIRGRKKALQGCWDRVSMDSPGLGREVIMRLDVDAHGAGSARLAGDSPTRHPKLTGCLAATLSRIDYPEAHNGAVQFSYPLRF